MSGQQNKIRIYDLAKELKLDNKKVIDDARREGIDVSVPSNSVPLEVAERIRTKYFPKKALPAAGPRLVKTIKKVEPTAAPIEEATTEFLEERPPQPEPTQPAPPTQAEPAFDDPA